MAVLLTGAGCRRGAATAPWLTYYSADHALTVLYPADWRTEQAEHEGSTYRYFRAPVTGPERRPGVTVTLVAGPLGTTLDDYARNYVGGSAIESTREETRPTARGRSWRFTSPDGATRYSLLLLQEESRVYGLYSQGETRVFPAHSDTLAEMEKTFALERYSAYVDERNEKYGFALKVPPSWKLDRNFSGNGVFSKQYTSPAFAADKRQTIHTSLTITAEPAPGEGTAEAFYEASRAKLGEAYKVFSHTPWKGGFVDVVGSETQVYMYRSKRFYRVADGRGYTLAFEGRDDVYGRAARWFDMIAATLRVGPELATP